MADPIGELEEMNRRAFALGPETMDVETAATFLAEQIAPKIVLREQLVHVGWISPTRGFEPLTVISQEERRAVFFVPPREEIAEKLELEVIVGMG